MIESLQTENEFKPTVEKKILDILRQYKVKNGISSMQEKTQRSRPRRSAHKARKGHYVRLTRSVRAIEWKWNGGTELALLNLFKDLFSTRSTTIWEHAFLDNHQRVLGKSQASDIYSGSHAQINVTVGVGKELGRENP